MKRKFLEVTLKSVPYIHSYINAARRTLTDMIGLNRNSRAPTNLADSFDLLYKKSEDIKRLLLLERAIRDFTSKLNANHLEYIRLRCVSLLTHRQASVARGKSRGWSYRTNVFLLNKLDAALTKYDFSDGIFEDWYMDMPLFEYFMLKEDNGDGEERGD